MLERYKKTFKGMQIVIWLVTIGVLVLTRRLNIAAGFFVMMQGGAILGAMWGARLKRLFDDQAAGRLRSRRS